MGCPWATRLTDNCTGHPGCPSRPSCSGSPNVFTNGLNQMRLSDCYVPHCNHPGILVGGSGTVFVNGLPAGRQGDPVNCGSLADEHSPDVKIGG